VIAIATQPIETVIKRLAADQDFHAKYCQDPDAALEAYLSPEEIRAIKTGDGHRLMALLDPQRWEELNAALCGPHSAVD
jgi:hypothetical protein